LRRRRCFASRPWILLGLFLLFLVIAIVWSQTLTTSEAVLAVILW
jgi:hypothetical protein